MNGKKILTLTIIAATLTVVAIYSSRDTYKKPSSKLGQSVFSDLPVNDISEIVIEQADLSLTMSRKDDIWVCKEKSDYPVKYDRLKDLVLKIADIKIGQIPVVNKSQLPEMGMTVPPKADSGTLVRLKNDKSDVLASLLIGKTRQSSSSTDYRGMTEEYFVSSNLGETVYLVKESFHYATPEPNGWLETELLNVPADDIVRMSIQSHDGIPLKFSIVDGEMTLEGIRDGEVAEKSTITNLRSALTSLHLNDIAESNLTDEQMGLDKPITYTAETAKGEIYTVQIGASPKATEERYVRLSAALSPAPNDDNKDTNDSEMSDEEKEQAKTQKEQKILARENLEKNIADLNSKFSKWTYTLATYKTDNMVGTRDAIVKPKTETKTSEDSNTKEQE